MGRCSRLTVLALLLWTAGWPVAAGGTTTRIQSLGGDGDYFEDSRNVLRWFGSLPGYGDQAFVELGEYSVRAGGDLLARQATDQGLGAHFTLDHADRFGTAAAYLFAHAPAAEDAGRVALLWARSWGNWQGGLYFSGWIDEKYSFGGVSGAQQQGRAQHTLGFGVRGDLGEMIYGDAAAELINDEVWQQDLDRGMDYTSQSSWRSYAMRARLFIGLSERVTLVPVLSHEKRDHLVFSDLLNDLAALDARQMRIGVGVNIFPDSDNLVLVSVEYRRGKTDQGGQQSLGALWGGSEAWYHGTVSRLAVESRAASWLTLRAGARHLRLSENEHFRRAADSPPEIPERRGGRRMDLELGLGLGVHFGAFDADFVLNDDAPFSLGNFLTGAGGGESASFSSATLAYAF